MVFPNVAKILAEIIGIDDEDIAPTTKLTIDNGVTPIDVAKVIIECEKKFNITVHDEDVHNFGCVNDIVEYIERMQSETDAAPGYSENL